MALADSTFKLYTNNTLTSLFTGTYVLLHKTSFSDNPQDYQLWLGSTTADRIIYAASNPGVANIIITPTYILPAWAASTAYDEGDSVIPTSANGFRYVVTVAGTSAGSEPTWPTTPIGQTVVDGSVTWRLESESHEITEIKLAATAAGLDTAVAGDPLVIGTELESGVANAFEINIRIENDVDVVSNNAATPELALYINAIREERIV